MAKVKSKLAEIKTRETTASVEDFINSVPDEQKRKDSFELLKLIGKGGYSQVFMARKKDSGQLYAIKIMDKKHLLSCMTPSAIVRECQINRKC